MTIADAWRAYGPLVAHHIHARLPHHDAEDVVQDVALRLCAWWHTYTPARASVKTYVVLVTRNTLADYLRHRMRTRTEPATEAITRDAPVDDPLDVRRLCHRHGLTEHESHMVCLIALRGLTFSATAAAMGVEVGTVKSTVSRVRKVAERLA